MEGLSKKSLIIGTVVLLILTGVTPSIYANTTKSQKIQQSQSLTNYKPEENYEYVIITNHNLKNSNFQHLINHKSQYLNATIVTIEEINSNPDCWVDGLYGDATSQSNGNPWIEDGKEVTTNFYRFNDTQAQIRNFIRFAYLEWNTRYVLLGGDIEIIPVRILRVDDAYWYSGTSYEIIDGDIPSDLYYAALHGTYNDDFDSRFGEDADNSIRDEADFIADVFVGRAPVDDKNDIIIFVKKTIHFETEDKSNDIQLHQSGLNDFNNPDTEVVPEACAQWIPSGFNIHKLYQNNEEVTVAKWVNAFRNPKKLLILHIGSGSELVYYLQRGVAYDVEFTIYDVNLLDNTYYPIHISVSCHSGNFAHAEDCLAERMLLWPYGGPSSCIFNSDYGFVTHLSALDYSGEIIVRQFYEMFENETENLGKIMQYGKEYFAASAHTDEGYRWCLYSVNLLGDPETPAFEKRNKLPIVDAVYVDDDYNENTPGWGKDHFDKIQDGVNTVNESGYVYVYDGVYSENIFIDKTINLIGENKESTIIVGGSMYDTIIIDSNSSLITNFTVTHSGGVKSIIDLNGIFISPGRLGNEIANNIITENSGYGVEVFRTCSANIHHNYISSNGFGIGLINTIEGGKGESGNLDDEIMPDICDNIVSDNTITLSESVGVYIAFAANNHVRYNRFENNCVSVEIPGINPNAFFINSVGLHNEWRGNYWDKPRYLPKAIHGRRGTINEFTYDISQDINIGTPSVEFDWRPLCKSRNYRHGFLPDFGNLRFLQLLEIIISKILNN